MRTIKLTIAATETHCEHNGTCGFLKFTWPRPRCLAFTEGQEEPKRDMDHAGYLRLPECIAATGGEVSDGRLARLARKAYAHCKKKGWSRDWREAGCYLHLEASEFTEALRGKGDFEQEAADVLFVLLSTMEAHNIGVDWVLEILEQRLKDAPTEAQKEQKQ